ncbi:MAG: DUF1259 domain-containing protein [Nitrospirae bacterium]|nr:DUF1259 domain-containing protein [Candidatus Troglogloeales bacterium]
MKKCFAFEIAMIAFIFSIQNLAFAEPSPKDSIPQQQNVYQGIEEITGLKGTWNDDKTVFKVTHPRSDVKVSVDGWQIPPFMGLTSWVGFQKNPKGGMMVMGDFVLFQDEVNPAMTVALENDLDVTALHNHFFYDEPKVYFMHIVREGNPENLALAIRKILDKIKEIRQKNPEPLKTFGLTHNPEKNSITPKTIEAILRVKGLSKDGMFKAVIGRNTTMPCNCEAGKDMGVNTWAAFAGADDHAIVDGDVAVLESELQPTLKLLRKSNINIVAIHHHMEGEVTRILFLHYWGIGSTTDLAQGLRSVIDIQHVTNKP